MSVSGGILFFVGTSCCFTSTNKLNASRSHVHVIVLLCDPRATGLLKGNGLSDGRSLNNKRRICFFISPFLFSVLYEVCNFYKLVLKSKLDVQWSSYPPEASLTSEADLGDGPGGPFAPPFLGKIVICFLK